VALVIPTLGRFGLLDAAQDEGVVALLRPVLDAAEEQERRALRIAPVQRALTEAVLSSENVFAGEDLVADDNALGPRLPTALVERPLVWLGRGVVHVASSVRLGVTHFLRDERLPA
jgi:hypothetical protein